MTQTPAALLKKLKSTPSFRVTPVCIEELAKLAVKLGPKEFSELWVELNPVTKKRAKRAAPQLSPQLKVTIELLTGFYKEREMKSAEAASALMSYSERSVPSLPNPTKASRGSVPAAVKWLGQKIGHNETQKLASEFVSATS